MRSFMATFADQKGTPYPLLNGVGGNKWGMVYAEGSASDPIWTLTGGLPTAVASHLSALGFHAPAYFGDMLTGTSDSPFVVLDRASGITVWGAGASKGVGNTIHVSPPDTSTTPATGSTRDARTPTARRTSVAVASSPIPW